MKRVLVLLSVSLILLVSCSKARFADPFIGTDYTGHTFPGASCPLGMVQPGPDTGNYSWRYCSGYNHSDPLIMGFTQNHLNGTGVPSLCNVLIMPFSSSHGEGFASRKSDETAKPGYYSVELSDNGSKVEITCSPRVACYTFGYGTEKRNLFVDLQNVQINDKKGVGSLKNAVLEWEGEDPGSNSMSGHLRIKSWVEYDLWYEILFDQDIEAAEKVTVDPEYTAPAYVLSFADSSRPVHAKISLSYTSKEGACGNMSEVDGWDFKAVERNAWHSWEEIFALLDIDADREIKKAFYTSMYHMYLQPNLISDLGEEKRYSTFSQWDTFRAADPLRTVLTPELEAEIVNSMIREADERGHLPVWDLCGKDNYCMIGNHAVPTVVDAAMRGLVDADRAYAAVKASLTVSHKKSDWAILDEYGYYPFDLVKVESVSRTLESSYDDYCAAVLAGQLGHEEDSLFFINRSRSYRNLFDPSTGFFRGKDSNGRWREDFEPYRYAQGSKMGGDYTEGNAWHYVWHVLQDPEDLISLLGGREKFVEKLDTLFSKSVPESITGEVLDVTGLIGQYSHGNEPSHHVIYLYTLAGRQDRAAEYIRQVFRDFYRNEPGGLCGNDDCGQMSAWYIFSAMGFYPLNPVSGEYVPGERQVRSFRIKGMEKNVFPERKTIDRR